MNVEIELQTSHVLTLHMSCRCFLLGSVVVRRRRAVTAADPTMFLPRVHSQDLWSQIASSFKRSNTRLSSCSIYTILLDSFLLHLVRALHNPLSRQVVQASSHHSSRFISSHHTNFPTSPSIYRQHVCSNGSESQECPLRRHSDSPEQEQTGTHSQPGFHQRTSP
jgi:hypothetical protein